MPKWFSPVAILCGAMLALSPLVIASADYESTMGLVQKIFYYHMPSAWIFLIAAMVCGFGESVSYVNLVKNVTGVDLDKSSRFTDWSRRPLSDKQLEYALGDEQSYVWAVSSTDYASYELPPRAEVERRAADVYARLTARGDTSGTAADRRARVADADADY